MTTHKIIQKMSTDFDGSLIVRKQDIMLSAMKRIDTSQVTSFFRETKQMGHFLPHLGLFGQEFVVSYCVHLHSLNKTSKTSSAN